MRIIIARHAKAEDHDKRERDEDRKLVDDGRDQAKLLGRVLKATNQVPGEVWTSPLIRCVETAEIAAKEFDGKVPVRKVQALAPGGDAEEIAFLVGKSGLPKIMLVGHAPDVGYLAAHLLGFKGEHHLKKGAFTLVEITDPTHPPGRSVATLEPKQYKAVLKGEMYTPWTKSGLTVQ
jgi:phosphohistidine phosphatase